MPLSEAGITAAARDSAPASKTRWRIILLLLLVTTFAFITRLSMSYAVRGIQSDFHLDNVQVGWILSAFVIGYGICQIPVGLAVDRWGPRPVLGAAIIGWSCLTLASAAVPALARITALSALGLFIGMRVITGAAQSCVLPAGNKMVSRWMPPTQRAAGNSLFFMGIGLGGILAPPFTVALMLRYGWQMPFWVLGVIGITIAVLWRGYATNLPEQHRSVNPAELALIRTGEVESPGGASSQWRWKTVLSNRSVIALVLCYGMGGYPAYVFYTWFYLYIANVRHVDPAAGGYWGMLPYIAIIILTPLGGRMSDALSLRFGKRIGRTGVGMMGCFFATGLIVAGARVDDARLAMILLALAAGFHLFGQAPAWASTIDLAPSRPATLFGLMNTTAQASGAVAPVLTPLLAQKLGWVHALDFAALLILLTGLLWFGINPEKPVVG